MKILRDRKWKPSYPPMIALLDLRLGNYILYSLDTAKGVIYNGPMKTQNTLIGIQDEYIETLNAGIERWSHRKDGGHSSRIARGARTIATKRLNKIGFSDQKQVDQILKDARDMAALIRNANVE